MYLLAKDFCYTTLDGRRKRPSASEFRAGIKEAIHEMLSELDVFQRVWRRGRQRRTCQSSSTMTR